MMNKLHPGDAASLFIEAPGRLERAMRMLSRHRTGKLLWPFAVALARTSRLWGASRVGVRLQGFAEMAALYAGVDHLICDCLRRRPHPTHAHLDAVIGWAGALGVGQLWLTHLDNSMDYATLAAELPDWAAPAHDGQEILP